MSSQLPDSRGRAYPCGFACCFADANLLDITAVRFTPWLDILDLAMIVTGHGQELGRESGVDQR